MAKDTLLTKAEQALPQARALLETSDYLDAPVGSLVYWQDDRGEYHYATITKHYDERLILNSDGSSAFVKNASIDDAVVSYPGGTQDVIITGSDGKVKRAPINKRKEQRNYIASLKKSEADKIADWLPGDASPQREFDAAYLALLMACFPNATIIIEPWRTTALRESWEEAGIPDSIITETGELGSAGTITGEFLLEINSHRTLKQQIQQHKAASPRPERLITIAAMEDFRVTQQQAIPDPMEGTSDETASHHSLTEWHNQVLEQLRIIGICTSTLASANRYNAVRLIAETIEDPAASILPPVDSDHLPADFPAENRQALKRAEDMNLLLAPSVKQLEVAGL